MPNGRTDIFEVEKEDFLIAIRTLNEDEEIGTTFGQPIEPVRLSDLEEQLLGHKEETVAIEEQREKYYIIHVGDDFYKWVCVMQGSRLFPQIKQLHLDHQVS